MITIYSDQHRLHAPEFELSQGKLVSPFECPQRADRVLQQIQDVGLGRVAEPESFDDSIITRVHDEAFVEFLRTAWQTWSAAGIDAPLLPLTWPARRHRQDPPETIVAQAGFYSHSNDTPILAGSWTAARSGAMVALTGAKHVAEGTSSFALVRPPGHHVAKDLYGGYGFLNNAALATEYLIDSGASRVAILDVDFHHGNGTQDIFYERNDVLFLSMHGDPAQAYPYFLGYADEKGRGAGTGFNVNYPLPPDTPFNAWRETLADALDRIVSYSPDALVVSLGVDTFTGDPISFFRLVSDDFRTYGQMIGALRRPTLFVMEGGYAVAEIGVNVVNVLRGFADA